MSHAVFLNDLHGRFAALSRTARDINAAVDRKRAEAKAKASRSAIRTKALAKPHPVKAAPAPSGYAPTSFSEGLAAAVRRQQAARAERPAATELTDRQQRDRSDAIWSRVLSDRAKRP